MKKSFVAVAVILLLFVVAGWLYAQSSSKSAQPKSSPTAPKSGSSEAIRLNNLGAAYMNQQAFERALKYFREAYSADPKMFEARLNEGIALLNLQKVQEALPILQEAVKRDPQSARAWYNLGLLHKSSGDAEPALQAFQKASELAPKDADAQYFLGLTYAQTGDNKNAAAAFQRAIAISPFHASAEFGLARAFQKLEQPDQAKNHLARFQYLTQKKIGTPITLAYGEQGQLSLVASVGVKAQQAGDPIPVRFTDASREAGLNSAQGVGSQGSSTAGACVLDFDGDGKPDLFLAGDAALLRNLGNGKFEDVTKNSGLAANVKGIACAAADFDNDGKIDLAVSTATSLILLHNDGSGKFRDMTESATLKAAGGSKGLLWADYDHDGDADLLVATAHGIQVWRNNGNNTFADSASDTGITFDGKATSLIASDVNNDRAVDLIATREYGAPVLFTNPREGKWNSSSPWPEGIAGATSVTTLDFNKDGWMDLAITTEAAPGLALLRNEEGKAFRPIELPKTEWKRGTSVVALDYDNDGFVDLITTGIDDKGGKPSIKLFRNLGADRFEDVTVKVALDRLSLVSEAHLTTADFDGDGDVDLLITSAGAACILLRNDGGNQNKSIRIDLKGLADNKTGLGTKIEVFAGDLWQKWEVHSGGGPGQSATEIVAGLGSRAQVDVVRLLWPSGVIQDEIEVPIAKPQEIVEIDRRGSSCPVLFAWDGKRYQFISDMLGAGVVGHWVGPDEKNVPDPTEYLKVDGGIVKVRNGRLSFRFMEPMEEVVYLDQVRLYAVDHPANVTVNPNEYFKSNPPYPDFQLVASDRRQITLPAGAWDGNGTDVLAHLRQSDHDYVNGFKLLNFSGFTEPHVLELDLGKPYQGEQLRLLMRGFIEYFTATSMYAAHQAGLDPVAPYVEARNANGQWKRVIDDMGFPAGLPRDTVADLTGKLPIGTDRIRIGTNLQIYWDQILVDRTAQKLPSRKTEVPLHAAKLAYHGYPRDVERKTNARGDHYYVFEDVSLTGPYAREAGAYTKLGNVTPLLTTTDDKFAVFGSGDAISLDFDPSKLPAVPKGWTRDYFFFADGYEKDMDFYAADGLTVDPLPYKSMKAYPYEGSGFLEKSGSVDYMLDHNTRFYSGNPAGLKSSYRFRGQK
jgi:Tfp pilus assembly protein PilF